MSDNSELKNTRFFAKSTGEECDIPHLKNKITQLSDNVCVNGIYYGEKENVTNNKKSTKEKYAISVGSAFIIGFFYWWCFRNDYFNLSTKRSYMTNNKQSSLILTTRVKSSWLELTIEDGNTKIVTSLWLDELESVKENLEEVIHNINYLIEKQQ